MNISRPSAMHQLRPAVKFIFGLFTLWLALVWAKLLPRPGFLPPEMEIEPLTVVLGTMAVLLFGFWKPKAPNPSSNSVDILEPSLQKELIANLKAKYQKRIDSKLAGRFPVNLRINASNTGTSEETAQSFITLQDEDVGHEIGEIFDRAKGRLLIVGLPGAGKTTLLLQLAVELLKRAESVPATSVAGNPSGSIAENTVASAHAIPAAKAAGTIPVLLNLATWRSEFGTFDEWLKRILPNELGASKALAEKIRANIPLVLLLDGLDEVPEQDRNSCLEALGQYGMKPGHQFALSSRIQEYAEAKDAPVYGQVEVAPLTASQIEQSLLAFSGLTPEAKPLLNAIQKDPLLKQAIENPFYLNTAQLLFASGKNWSEFGFVATDVEGRQRELVERFVGWALVHKVKRDYKPEDSKKWLGFLAGKMEKGKLRVFELVNMQPWWYTRSANVRFVYAIICLFFVGCVLHLLARIHHTSGKGIRDQPIENTTLMIYTSAYLLFFYFTKILFSPDPISIREGILWSWKKFKKGLTGDILTFGCLTVLGFMCLAFFIDWGWDVAAAILVAIFVLGFFYSAINIFSRGVLIKNSLIIKQPYLRFINSIWYLNFNILDHLILRILLWIACSLPLRLVHFLNEMSRRHLLEFDGNLDTETGGGSWRWRHRIIQEYFLTMNDEL